LNVEAEFAVVTAAPYPVAANGATVEAAVPTALNVSVEAAGPVKVPKPLLLMDRTTDSAVAFVTLMYAVPAANEPAPSVYD